MRGGEIPDELKLSGSDLCRDKPAPWALGCLWGHHSLAVFVAAELPLPLPVGFLLRRGSGFLYHTYWL